jgi:hypothetical protein
VLHALMEPAELLSCYASVLVAVGASELLGELSKTCTEIILNLNGLGCKSKLTEVKKKCSY